MLGAFATALPWLELDTIIGPMREKITHIEPLLEGSEEHEWLQHIRQWTEDNYTELIPAIMQRKAHGMVCECNGDMHLANMAIVDGRLEIFDGIDFNPDLRWIDVMSEIAFLAMDLQDRGTPRWSRRQLNRYLEHTCDYPGLALLRLYQVYRAMVRAKVCRLRLQQEHIEAAERSEIMKDYQAYVDLAERYTLPRQVALIITHGFSGSGKTTLTELLLEEMSVIRSSGGH